MVKSNLTTLLYALGLSTGLTASALAAESRQLATGVLWENQANPELIAIAEGILEQSSLPDELTHIYYRNHTHIDKETVTSRIQSIWYYPNASSIQSTGNEIVSFNQANETLRLKSALSLASSGATVPFQPDSLQIIDPDNYNTFSDIKHAVIAIPGLQVGGMSILEYEITLDKTTMEIPWSDLFFNQKLVETRDYQLQVTHSGDTNIQFYNGGASVDCVEHDNGFTCSAEKIPALKKDPAVYWLDQQDPVIVTEGDRSWSDIAGIINRKVRAAISDSDALDRLFEEITHDKETLSEKIAAIHEFTARDIRYNSMSELGHQYTPHSAALTAANRYGDCKDKSALLIALLERLDLKPIPVLVATERKRPEKLAMPSLAYFDHMVVCSTSSEQRFCMDATDASTDWETISPWIQGSAALPLIEEASPIAIPKHKYRWRMESSTTIAFDSKGGQREENSRVYSGEYAGLMRNALAAKSEEELAQWARQEYSMTVSDRAQPEFRFVGIEPMTSELEIHSEATFDPFLDKNSALTYQEQDAWMNSELRSMKVENVHYGYDFPGLKVNSSFHFDLGTLWKLSFPGATLELEHKYGSLKRLLEKTADSKLTVRSSLQIPAQFVPANEIEDFNEFLSLLRRETNIQFLAQKNSQP
ncbi:DUF3857 domain-containing protein [Microbulbifer guangxiensis]|uniref:DUF3857 domain-containing protein n=1 Tax=Microbulbifer guangxiensis TaxID=2904249 RepID=UPI001F18B151|nr:DUF3857 domain-containing protein [Microbulbifer guangxiensis]